VRRLDSSDMYSSNNRFSDSSIDQSYLPYFHSFSASFSAHNLFSPDYFYPKALSRVTTHKAITSVHSAFPDLHIILSIVHRRLADRVRIVGLLVRSFTFYIQRSRSLWVLRGVWHSVPIHGQKSSQVKFLIPLTPLISPSAIS